MNSDFPWIIVAMIFIAFVRWLMDRLNRGNRGPEDFEADFELEPDQQAPARPPRPPRPASYEDPQDELRRFLESLREGPPAEPEVEEPPAPVLVEETAQPTPPPPPLPAAPPARSIPKARLPKPLYTTPDMKAVLSPRYAALLADQRDLQNAFVLKEIFDPPVSMRESPMPHRDF